MNHPSYQTCVESEAARIIAERSDPLAVELLATEDQRRTLSIDDNAEARTQIREEISRVSTPPDEDDLCQHFRNGLAIPGPSRMRKSAETKRLEDLLDSLGKDGQS